MAKDLFHFNARSALEKDGWKITNDPFRLGVGETQMEVDFAGEKLIEADKNGELIVVEVKSFLNKSMIYDFHLAIGQYSNYRSALKLEYPNRNLYLAVSDVVFNTSFFQSEFVQFRLKEEAMKLIIFRPDTNEIVQWIK